MTNTNNKGLKNFTLFPPSHSTVPISGNEQHFFGILWEQFILLRYFSFETLISTPLPHKHYSQYNRKYENNAFSNFNFHKIKYNFVVYKNEMSKKTSINFAARDISKILHCEITVPSYVKCLHFTEQISQSTRTLTWYYFTFLRIVFGARC